MNFEQKRRELFEAAAIRDWDKSCHDFVRLADGYQDDLTDIAWWGFNAALGAVEIELPMENERGHITRMSAIRAIESTGLKVKP